MSLNDNDFLRYSRQLLLEEYGLEGQEKLNQARVLIIGLGGLGSPAALYLAAAGVGTLHLADDDLLHISNLQRQVLYRSDETGQAKAELARNHLLALNPQIEVIAHCCRVDEKTLPPLLSNIDLVLDCTDNMIARQTINAACVGSNTPLITASAIGFSGQLLLLTPPWTQGCYRCLWPDEAEPLHNCRTAGVLGPVVGIMGAQQALEALKLLAGCRVDSGKLRLFDGRQQSWHHLTLAASQYCPICGGPNANSSQ
ncbi:hypothetical protein BTJ39_22755 [Izhakiella australiensis]|uniref:THIF-type NAD/FAD binding fold domain-containing protein n=1 Tax=Izhakiella australiensis TaxID=1926881 RepID=A0A1S8YA34_9GAMM|nr:HesA/MoeB/ThiF family protein [Izhakiella australiensis]OON35543.1 hypothetical protein BTJ39_22755 [Izhakiella australiensis]